MTPDQMREWENRLGPEKVDRAIQIVRSHGWARGSTPPTWVWAEAFAMVDGKIPEQWGNSNSALSPQEAIFGMKLF